MGKRRDRVALPTPAFLATAAMETSRPSVAYADLRDGAMAPTPGDLARLLGRPTEPLAATMKTWL
ncbi:hypothetical protein GCM10010412_050160 [Nonomuraea recticatena]|uniref:Uncharacterized protein n=1 Tax=Nonomuraea recticatena TaxID=46178 RepID=A0ABP6ELR3_9ACTN